jgi:hypothetical protein
VRLKDELDEKTEGLALSHDTERAHDADAHLYGAC